VTEHRFTKGVMDYASGAIPMVESRVREYTAKNGKRPAQLLLHAPTARRLFAELAERLELPPIPQPEDVIKPGTVGMVGGIPFLVCGCGDDLGEDLISDAEGNTEPL
jgi:hypothetical protein